MNTVMDSESIRSIILVAKNSLLLFSRHRAQNKRRWLTCNQKQITEAVEQAELPQVMPLIEIGGELQIFSYVRETYQPKC